MADMAHPDSSEAKLPGPALNAGFSKQTSDGLAHPSGRESHGRVTQVLRGLSFGLYFFVCCTAYVCVPRLRPLLTRQALHHPVYRRAPVLCQP
jgi:hypothetical protein